jgi:hypothetical protein
MIASRAPVSMIATVVAAAALALGCDEPSPIVTDAAAARDARAATDAASPPLDGGPIEPGPWTFVVLPDTQILAASHPDIFEAQTRWIVEQRDALSIQFVLHVGDIVDDNGSAQWDVARASLGILDGRVPYVLAPGNHDYGIGGSASDRETMLDAYFPVSLFDSLPSFGGTFAEGSIENSYHLFTTPTGPWLVVAVEFGPRDDVVAWADAVIAAHPGIPAIVVTHAYLYSDDTRYDWLRRPDQQWSPYSYGLASAPGGVNDGEEMFQRFVRHHDPIDLVVCGHVLNDGIGELTSDQDGGGRVHQLLANFQHQPEGGAGYLRIMTVSADGAWVDVRTYSPYLDTFLTDAENQTTLELDP